MFGRNTLSHLVGQKEKVAFGCPHKYLVGGAPFGAHPPNGSLMGTPCTDTLKDGFSYQLDHHLYSWKISSFWRRLQFTSIAIMLHSFAICIFSRILMHLPDYAFMQPLFGIEFYGSAATITIQASANRWDFVQNSAKVIICRTRPCNMICCIVLIVNHNSYQLHPIPVKVSEWQCISEVMSTSKKCWKTF